MLYKIFYNGQHDLAPYWVGVKTEAGFWQQVSPNYVHEHSCRKWAARKGVTLSKQSVK